MVCTGVCQRICGHAAAPKPSTADSDGPRVRRIVEEVGGEFAPSSPDSSSRYLLHQGRRQRDLRTGFRNGARSAKPPAARSCPPLDACGGRRPRPARRRGGDDLRAGPATLPSAPRAPGPAGVKWSTPGTAPDPASRASRGQALPATPILTVTYCRKKMNQSAGSGPRPKKRASPMCGHIESRPARRDARRIVAAPGTVRQDKEPDEE
jgi:hypothetical protein